MTILAIIAKTVNYNWDQSTIIIVAMRCIVLYRSHAGAWERDILNNWGQSKIKLRLLISMIFNTILKLSLVIIFKPLFAKMNINLSTC